MLDFEILSDEKQFFTQELSDKLYAITLTLRLVPGRREAPMDLLCTATK